MDQPNLVDLVGSLRSSTDAAIERLQEKLNETGSTSGKKISAKELAEMVRRQQAVLERIMESAAFIGEVIAVIGDQNDPKSDVFVSCYGRILSVKPLPGVSLGAGDMVKLAPNSSQIIGVIDRFNVGSICTVRKVIDDGLSEVDFNGAVRIVMNGKYAGRLFADDRVVLDSSGSTIVAHMGKSSNRFQLGSRPSIVWDDICGLDKAKQQLQEMIETPIKFPGLYGYYNLRQPNGALIFGPPGCGKTLLLEAVATAMAQLHGAEGIETGFINVKGPEILDMYVGNSERNVRALFMLAKKHKEKHGYPAVIAIDEAEAILGRRGSGISSDMEKTVVTTFLAEMNGIDDSSAIVFLATNRQKMLDPAVIRDKRLDRIIKVGRPNRQSAEAILRLRLRHYPLESNVDVEELVRFTAEEFYSTRYKIYEVERTRGDKQEVLVFKLSDLINGAMVAAIVDDKAVWLAFQRDKANGGEADASKRSGISQNDLIRAVEDVYEQKFELDHKDELADFVADFSDEVSGVKKMRLTQVQKI